MYDDGHLVRFEEGEFETNYPEAAAYLNDFRDDLDERQSDTSANGMNMGGHRHLLDWTVINYLSQQLLLRM